MKLISFSALVAYSTSRVAAKVSYPDKMTEYGQTLIKVMYLIFFNRQVTIFFFSKYGYQISGHSSFKGKQMKKNLLLFRALFVLSVMFSGCKKEATTAPPSPKDYRIAISDKTWWGTLTNAGETAQYYSVHFNADNTLTWSQFSGDYQGSWIIDNKKLTLTFTNPAVVVTGEIADDNKLTGITTSTANKVNTAELIANPNIQLEGSVWMGSRIYNMSKPPSLLQLSFMANNTVQIKVDNQQYGAASYAYTRPASGGCIRLKDLKYFGIIKTEGEMRGCEFTYDRPWQAYKQ